MKRGVLEEGEGVTCLVCLHVTQPKRGYSDLLEKVTQKLLIICFGLHFNTLQT